MYLIRGLNAWRSNEINMETIRESVLNVPAQHSIVDVPPAKPRLKRQTKCFKPLINCLRNVPTLLSSSNESRCLYIGLSQTAFS